ncbi:PucR family transcriptional regulator [Bacillus sp. B1-b2]|uniref:PucR family transcriptional regulator n=1 Tax=Bacillus sp. B1-b2 TaxID=2653201 RepID=UPI00126249A0|nr:helix-turn-helix domain-containing protein [Bacillus sp. B1-b2]KAB7666864.1 hypothetical protein F9279_16505 [Bacillus sp. B1-b2]
MKHKLLAYYNNTLEQSTPPLPSQLEEYHWFKINDQEGWIGISKQETEASQLELLQACFDYFQPDVHSNNEAYYWNQYLHLQGEQPTLKDIESLRMVQFTIHGDAIDKHIIESAFKGFIHSNSLLLWNGPTEGLLIEKNNQFLEEEDFIALAQALQSDFYFSIYFYMGKVLSTKDQIPTIYMQERNLFRKGNALMPSNDVLSLETILPNLLISRLHDEEISLFKEWFSIFQHDKELLLTIKTFIENNGHSTNAAKQLFIHRNTLQYRLEKFTEKTGFQLKNYNNYFITYLACLYYSSGNLSTSDHL